ncbi:hypothetical protein [uncultured Sunxiuqinia sp.]|uniref:hypothetical protein n=1 Tax=uncultured Sunxiuqinia sp. TaxID=1573825 RepID=UPI0030D9F824
MKKNYPPQFWLIIGCILMVNGPVLSQNNTSSPYSMYGLGELRFQSNPHNSAMGNAGIGMASDNFLNTLNPASYSTLDSMTFLFEMGVDGQFSEYKSRNKTASSLDANFSYLALGLRINRWVSAGFGLNPYSSTGYEINTTSVIGGIQQDYPLSIIGSGDISRAYFTTSFTPIKKLSLGLKASYLFGNQSQNQYHDLTKLGTVSISNETTDYFNNFYWEFGIQYQLQHKSSTLRLGAIYNPRQQLQTRRVNTTSNSADVILQYEEESTGEFVIPEEIGLGFSWQKGTNLLVAMDVGMQRWSDESYDILGVELNNNPYFHGGMEYLPSSNLRDAYYKRMNYRLGFQYAQSYLNLRDIQLDEVVLSFGLGLPIQNQKSRIDMSFEFGKQGTTNKNLIQENFFRFRLGFSLKDTWFSRPKYN